ncbi:MAG: DUF1097 domain-containing protein [Atopobiaceae bacterium]|nr:DUF1097 domain-containing protein [Atopobiaceae bacterium]MBQ3283627.1 DUF1097 domain-containing protein [Atopobiaceae bacterium]MBQ6410575.1 DUF1097 domain-containing protein [Atopobiaceae bacterium]MBQ6651684.1 DUF1097 domain-containing protein [Atopobiaceae bacterium]MBR3385053.1 DUF1097 domain-containing protein [Atopobiaceae bacterium]
MKKEVLALATGIALLPPLWAVLSGHAGITCGAVALICAGIYVTNGNKAEDGVKISLGFLLSDLMAVAAMWCMENLPFSADVNTFLTLAVIGFVAVIFASAFEKWIFLPAVLCGWAIGLTVMGPLGTAGMGSLPIQIAVAMLAGVWYVGWGVDAFCKLLLKGRA